MQDNRILRFAPLIRVSSERQEKKGESLRTQRHQIEDAVKSLGGMIPDSCWEYSGQESATPGQERRKLDKLLADSGKDLFDAIIVCDPSRWSRDNIRNEQGLETLLNNDILFFAGTTEYNLNDPQARFYLAMNAIMNQFQARTQAKKSVENRIHRAKRGVPTAGKIPYGRIYDKQTNTWSIDPEKQKKIQWAANQFITGKKGLEEIARILGTSKQNLWETLRKKSGDSFEIKFIHPKYKINEIIKISVPPLLSQDTINAIHKKLETNKTYSHTQCFHKYLLGRMIFCSECGRALTGHRDVRGNFFEYMHPKKESLRCPNNKRWRVKASVIEEAVMAHIFSMRGNQEAIEQALQRAIPNLEEIEQLREQVIKLERELEKISAGKDKIIDAITEGLISNEDIKTRMSKLKEREAAIKVEIEMIRPRIENVPTQQQTEKRSKLIERVFKTLFRSQDAYLKMTYTQKRALLQNVFNGKDAEGRRLGVYIKKNGKEITYTINGIFPEKIVGTLPMSELEKEELLRIEVPYNPLFDQYNFDISADITKSSTSSRAG